MNSAFLELYLLYILWWCWKGLYLILFPKKIETILQSCLWKTCFEARVTKWDQGFSFGVKGAKSNFSHFQKENKNFTNFQGGNQSWENEMLQTAFLRYLATMGFPFQLNWKLNHCLRIILHVITNLVIYFMSEFLDSLENETGTAFSPSKTSQLWF